jgi:AcrR family transcriptional regulator
MSAAAVQPVRTTGRGLRRRRAIVAAAAELFAHRGYPAVGMDDIGAAAGVTGPAISRHFESKATVLAAVIDGIIDAVDRPEQPAGGPSSGTPVVPAATAADSTTGAGRCADPAGALAAHIARYASAVAERRELMAVFVQEVHHLPEGPAQQLRHRQRDLVARWRVLLAQVHPQWPAERVRTAVHAVFGMLNAVGTFASPLGDAELADQLTALASDARQLPGR